MTMLPSIYFPENTPDVDAIYENELVNRFYYWPLIFSQSATPLSPSGLSSADSSVYYTYSGVDWKYTTVARQKDGRYRNITVKTVSGDSFYFYLQTSLTPDQTTYHAGPVTASGSYYTLTKYTTISGAEANPVEFTSVMNSGVFTLSDTEQARSITLSHKAVASGQSYRIYQFLPRTSIEVDDLSADVIDVVTLRVSDSIVVSPDIPNKSITGAKILDGTVSGVLITPGTITANEIAAGTITGSKISANTISGALLTAGTITFDKIASKTLTSEQIADASITGANIVAGTVSGVLITDSAITASKIAAGTITGDKIAANTISGVLITAGTITSDKLQVNSLSALSTNTGSLNVTNTVTVTSGQISAGLVNITQSGISIGNVATELTETNALRIYGKINPSGGNVVGMALYNNLNPTTPHAVFQTDFDNALEIENLAPNGVTNINIPQGPYESAFNVWVADPVNPQFSVGYDYTDVRNELYLSNNLTMTEGNYANLKGTTTIQGDFYVNKMTGSPPSLFTVTSGQATFNVPAVFNSGLSASTPGYSPFFGDGSDGVIYFDGSTASVDTNYCTYLFPAYTLTRDIYARSLAVASGVVIETNGFRIFCLNTLTNYGVIRNNGQSGVSGVTTGAAGGAGNFFRAGGAGAAGYGTTAAGAVGLAPPTQTNTVGGIGGRGAAAHSSVVSQETSPITAITMQPAAAVGGHKLISNITSFMQPYLPLGTSNVQFTPSIGGGSGAKGGTGSGARSGAGGGGGGVVFVAASKIVNSGVIQANGGDGGPASGAGANLGGGGGGGGGIVGLVYSRNATGLSNIPNCEANPGVGGDSVRVTNPSRAVLVNRENVLLSGTKYTTGTILNKNSTYFLVFHSIGGYVTGVDHPNMLSWDITAQSYGFATAASPTRYLQVFQLYYINGTSNIQDYQELNISFSAGVTSCRMVIDEVQNLGDPALWYPQGYNNNSVDSGTSLAIDLGYVPNANNVVYTAYARTGGGSPTAGTGNSVILSTTTSPAIFTMASLGRQTNNHAWTGAFAAAGLSLDLGTHDLYSPIAELSERGATGWHGKVMQFWV